MKPNAEARRLVRRLLAGDERAFAEFFDDAFPRLFRFALSRVGNESLAEEIAQATLTRAIRKLATYRGESALSTWLFTFCRHEIHAAFDRLGSDVATVPLLEDRPAVRSALEALAAESATPEDAARRRDLRRLVHVALDALSPRYARALEWKYFEEAPVTEIALRLEISAKAAESMLTRARNAFREAFAVLSEEEAR